MLTSECTVHEKCKRKKVREIPSKEIGGRERKERRVEIGNPL